MWHTFAFLHAILVLSGRSGKDVWVAGDEVGCGDRPCHILRTPHLQSELDGALWAELVTSAILAKVKDSAIMMHCKLGEV